MSAGVIDKQDRPITADRIIAGARAAGLKLERCEHFLRPSTGCCCAGGGLALSADRRLTKDRSTYYVLLRILTDAQRWGLSDGFEGETKEPDEWGDTESYLACYAIGREVWERRHEAEVAAPIPTGEPTP